MSRAVMQQALEALVTCCAEEWRTLNNFGMKQVYDEKKVNAAIAALHAALLADVTPAQMAHADAVAEPQTTHWEGCEAVHPECKAKPITADEMSAWVKDTWEKCQAEAWQEPCAMRYDFDGYGYRYIDSGSGSNWQTRHKDAEPLFTSPTPRKPLTEGEIEAMWQNTSPYYDHQDFARAIERKHGIGEQV